MIIYNPKEGSLARGNILKLPISGYDDTQTHAYACTLYHPFQITFLDILLSKVRKVKNDLHLS